MMKLSELEELQRIADQKNFCKLTGGPEAPGLDARRAEILRHIDALPDYKQKAVLILHYDAGMSYAKIAAALDCSLRHVYGLRRKAICDDRRTVQRDKEG